MDIYRAFATLKQGCNESMYEYFERFKYYLDCCPYHGFELHELMKFLLDGLCMRELMRIDVIAGKWIMDCTPEEAWDVIQARAVETKPYTEYVNVPSDEMHATKERIEHGRIYLAQCQAELAKELAAIAELEKIIKKKRELKSEPEPVQPTSDNETLRLPMIERDAEDTKDEELQVVPMTSVEDVPTEEWISPQCSDLIIKQDTVITCSPVILPISDIRLSPPAQNDTIHKALRNIQVWGSLQICKIHIPIVRTSMKMQKLEQFLEGSCINWKFRKKREEKMGGSSRKVAFRTQRACATQRLRKLIEILHRMWKKRKKGKRISLNKEVSLFLMHLKKSHSTFGWKPGWNAWRSVSRQVARNVRKPVRKFDGVHPWSPNISGERYCRANDVKQARSSGGSPSQ